MSQQGSEEAATPEPQTPKAFFTPEKVDAIWECAKPIDDLTNLLVPKLQHLEEHQCLPILAEHLLHYMCLGKQELGMSSEKTAIWMEMMLELILEPIQNKRFSLPDDLARYKTLVAENSSSFTKEELTALSQAVAQGYFAHYNLFTFIFTVEREQVLLESQFVLYQPADQESLDDAVAQITERTIPDEEKEEEEIELTEEQKFEKTMNSFHDSDQKRVKSVLKKISEKLEKQMEKRASNLEEKYQEIEREKNKSAQGRKRK